MSVKISVFAAFLSCCLFSTALGVVWEPGPRVGSEQAGTSPATIDKFGGMPSANFPDFEFINLKAIVGMEYVLEATRASGDKDTRRYEDPCEGEPEWVADTLKTGWPRWWSPKGHFEDWDDTGTYVVWIAPAEEADGVMINLYEDDKPEPVPPGETGSRDDVGWEGYGHLQDRIIVNVLPIDVAFHVRVSGTTMNNTGTYGTNSRDKLGLWKGTIPNGPCPLEAFDYTTTWRSWCVNPVEGDFNNGGVSYTGNHPWKVGTVLKTEMYARITNGVELRNQYLPQSSKDTLNDKDNWKIEQNKKGWVKHNGEFMPGKNWTTWTSDGTYQQSDWDAFFDPEFDHLYIADTPGFTKACGGEDGDTYEKQVQYRDQVEFQVTPGQWIVLCPFPDGEAWLWKLTKCKLKKVSGQ